MKPPNHKLELNLNQSNPPTTLPDSNELRDWLNRLELLHPKNIELGLDRIVQVFTRMQLARLAPKVITVAGTNGKGSTCAYIESCLLASGYRVGVYSSPHLISYRERLRINGRELDDASHVKALEQVEQLRGETALTFFEFSTLAMFQLLNEAELDVVILEVGLGGRLDATNIIDADVAVVTTVAQDHEAFLGNDIEQIGREKAGVFRPGKPAIMGDKQLPYSVAEVAEQLGATPLRLGVDFELSQQADGFCYQSENCRWPALKPKNLPLENLATALAALEYTGLAFAPAAIADGVARAALPGRWQLVSEQPQIRLDVAHNPQATGWLAARIGREKVQGRVVALVGMLADKDSMSSLHNMLDVVDDWHVASLAVPRGAMAEQLLASLPKTAKPHADVATALAKIQPQLGKEDLLIVFGSFYTVAAVLTA